MRMAYILASAFRGILGFTSIQLRGCVETANSLVEGREGPKGTATLDP